MNEPIASRRRFLAQLAAAAVALPLLANASQAQAAPAAAKPKFPMLPLTNPQAKALSYVEDAKKTKSPAHKPGSFCHNCQFFTAATGACTLFAGFSVAPDGWCTAWAKKA